MCVVPRRLVETIITDVNRDHAYSHYIWKLMRAAC
jgi:hypothetical protein